MFDEFVVENLLVHESRSSRPPGLAVSTSLSPFHRANLALLVADLPRSSFKTAGDYPLLERGFETASGRGRWADRESPCSIADAICVMPCLMGAHYNIALFCKPMALKDRIPICIYGRK
jgi:hypothetical protein